MIKVKKKVYNIANKQNYDKRILVIRRKNLTFTKDIQIGIKVKLIKTKGYVLYCQI